MVVHNLIRNLSILFKKRNKPDQDVINQQTTTKNKWLYPTDNFGKLERGVVYFLESNNVKL